MDPAGGAGMLALFSRRCAACEAHRLLSISVDLRAKNNMWNIQQKLGWQWLKMDEDPSDLDMDLWGVHPGFCRAPSPRACLKIWKRWSQFVSAKRWRSHAAVYFISASLAIYIYISLLWNKCFGIQPWKDIGYQIWQIWKGMRPEKKYIQMKGRPNHLQEGSPDRIGFDQHVLPNLYAAAQGVYAARHDQAWRVKLLQAAPEERRCLDGHGIWDG